MQRQALAVMEAALAHTAAAQQAASRPLSPTLSSGDERGDKKEGPGPLLQDWPTAVNPDAHAASKVALFVVCT